MKITTACVDLAKEIMQIRAVINKRSQQTLKLVLASLLCGLQKQNRAELYSQVVSDRITGNKNR